MTDVNVGAVWRSAIGGAGSETDSHRPSRQADTPISW